MENQLTNPDVLSLIFAFLVKIKVYAVAVLIAFVSGFIKYIQDKRTGVKSTFKDFLMFSIVASFITLSALAVMQYLGMEIDFLSMMIMFWLGIFTDYIYGAIGKLIEAIGNKIIKNQGNGKA